MKFKKNKNKKANSNKFWFGETHGENVANVSTENVAAHNLNIRIVTPKTGRSRWGGRGVGVAAEKSHANDPATSMRSVVYKLLLSVLHEYIYTWGHSHKLAHSSTISPLAVLMR